MIDSSPYHDEAVGRCPNTTVLQPTLILCQAFESTQHSCEDVNLNGLLSGRLSLPDALLEMLQDLQPVLVSNVRYDHTKEGDRCIDYGNS